MCVVCLDCVLCPPGSIPAELGQLATLRELFLSNNQLTGTPFIFSSRLEFEFNMKKETCFPYDHSFRSDRMACLLYDLTVFCISQGPFRLNLADWRNWSCCGCTPTNLPVLHLSFPLDLCSICIQSEGIGLLSLCSYALTEFVYPRSHPG